MTTDIAQVSVDVPTAVGKVAQARVVGGVGQWDVSVARARLDMVQVRVLYSNGRGEQEQQFPYEYNSVWNGVDEMAVSIVTHGYRRAELQVRLIPAKPQRVWKASDVTLNIGGVDLKMDDLQSEATVASLVTVNKAREALGLPPLEGANAEYGDLTVEDFAARQGRVEENDTMYSYTGPPETDEELRTRLQLLRDALPAIDNLGTLVETAQGFGLEMLAEKHGLHRKGVVKVSRNPGETDEQLRERLLVAHAEQVASEQDEMASRLMIETAEQMRTDAPPPAHGDLVIAEREAEELLEELTEFGCNGQSKRHSDAVKQWTDGTLTVQDKNGVDLPLINLTVNDLQFYNTAVTPVFGEQCSKCGADMVVHETYGLSCGTCGWGK